MKFALLSIVAVFFLLSGCENKKESKQNDVDDFVDVDFSDGSDFSDESDDIDTVDEQNEVDAADEGNDLDIADDVIIPDETEDFDSIDDDIDETADTFDDNIIPDEAEDIDNIDESADTADENDTETAPDTDIDEISDDSEAIPDDDAVFDPCASNPCVSIENSDGICTVDGTGFVCGCSGSYHFNKTETSCLQTLQIGWCNTQYPVDLTNADSVIYGAKVSFYTQFYINGITAATTITNVSHTSSPAYPQIIAQIGTGGTGTNASGWTDWSVSALPNEDKGNNDEYLLLDQSIDLIPGNYDFIIRISGDSGNSWTYCNANRLAGSGYNGTDSVNLYDPAKNGHITVTNPPE